MEQTPKLIWDIGTSYDLFISLEVLHEPERYGLRANWAAGVRSRLSPEQREFLQDVIKSRRVWPIPWVASLSGPKNSAAVLAQLEKIPADRRLIELTRPYMYQAAQDILHPVAQKNSWTAQDQTDLYTVYNDLHREGHIKRKTSEDEVEKILTTWAESAKFGESYLDVLQTYYDVFFHEEETRIWPALQHSSAQAQQLVQELSLDELLTTLSQGLRFSYDGREQMQEILMVPSFWTTPLSWFNDLGHDGKRWLFLFGGRPNDVSLVPGEMVPELLYNTLKALADPTRLRILKHLTEEPLTPAELARRLRLRPPTVIHHLDVLRLARLVSVTISKQGRRYETRQEAIDVASSMLNSFVGNKP